MGRKGLGGLIGGVRDKAAAQGATRGRAGKAALRRKKIGASGVLGGGSPAEQFLARFAARRRPKNEPNQAGREALQRLESRGQGGSIFARLFGQGR